MTGLFEAAGVKRYVIRRRETAQSPWEYPPELQYSTLEEARAALAALPLSGGCELAELWPSVRYKPGEDYRDTPLLSGLLERAGMKHYVLQKVVSSGEWEIMLDSQFDTLEEAQEALFRLGGGKSGFRVARAGLVIEYLPAA